MIGAVNFIEIEIVVGREFFGLTFAPPRKDMSYPVHLNNSNTKRMFCHLVYTRVYITSYINVIAVTCNTKFEPKFLRVQKYIYTAASDDGDSRQQS